nr:MAG TPA_asm: hypothetical protein [Caudoviricetes sp.]
MIVRTKIFCSTFVTPSASAGVTQNKHINV